MEELYRVIEEKIQASGCPIEIDGHDFYNDVSAEADDKDNGTYLFIIKKSDEVSYHGCVKILDDEFDLPFVDIHVGDEVYHVDFDA